EDWYEGMDALGATLERAPVRRHSLEHLSELVGGIGPEKACVTLFVVANHASRLAVELVTFAAQGHEIACHGADHGVLPSDPGRLQRWLEDGRHRIEDVIQRTVEGFRPPRFDIPVGLDLPRWRALIRAAGFTYVSDRHLMGPRC